MVVEANDKESRLIEAWHIPSAGGKRTKLTLATNGFAADPMLAKGVLIFGVIALVAGLVLITWNTSSTRSGKKTN